MPLNAAMSKLVDWDGGNILKVQKKFADM